MFCSLTCLPRCTTQCINGRFVLLRSLLRGHAAAPQLNPIAEDDGYGGHDSQSNSKPNGYPPGAGPSTSAAVSGFSTPVSPAYPLPVREFTMEAAAPASDPAWEEAEMETTTPVVVASNGANSQSDAGQIEIEMDTFSDIAVRLGGWCTVDCRADLQHGSGLSIGHTTDLSRVLTQHCTCYYASCAKHGAPHLSTLPCPLE